MSETEATPSIRIRPIRVDDIEVANSIMNEAFDFGRPATSTEPTAAPVTPAAPPNMEQAHDRLVHLITSDPNGCFVAESDDGIAGIALSHRREDSWVLAILAIRPEQQDRGIGKDLLEESLRYGQDASGRAIFSSRDPRALHRYTSAGFALHPAVRIEGAPRHRPAANYPRITEASLDDIELVARIDKEVRGASRSTDIEWMLRWGQRLLVDSDEGYVVYEGGRIGALSAINPASAQRLLEAIIARCPEGEEVRAGWVCAEQQWAFRTAANAGLSIVPSGPIMADGWRGLTMPYIPNGFFG